MTQVFLSCLFGSEAYNKYREILRGFLSCLFGSEEESEPSYVTVAFLSCLFGSEVVIHRAT
ncbi:hypothetical protein AEST_19720 [Alishewanella aestuarii B11]|uniref:Uncharacterized protein n=1 Tax=Alishewanella aestuarii B11 TaxID=1197174 RepID=J1YAQ1_9ALTE|nr:hypothetical protein AEST_19720 [Alishewanella aestuarii B11]